MEHEKPLSSIAYQNADGSVGKLSIHDTDAIHDGVGSVDSDNIADGSVRTEDIASKAVTEEKLADNAVGADAIKDGVITQEKFAPEVFDSLLECRATTIASSSYGDSILYELGKLCILNIRTSCNVASNGSMSLGTLPERIVVPKNTTSTLRAWNSTGKSSHAYCTINDSNGVGIWNGADGVAITNVLGEVVFINQA